MTSRRSQRTAFYNACGSIDWTNELNHGLSSWHIVLPSTDQGPVWHDLCGNYHGTLTNLDVNAAWPGSTRSGSWGAFLPDGVDGYVSLAGGGGLNNVQSGTISMWVRWVGTQDAGIFSNNGAVLGRQQAAASFSNHVISLSTTNPNTAKIRVAAYIGNVFALTSATSPGDGVWRHIIWTYSSGAHRLYLDGVQDASSSSTGTMGNDANTALTIGGWIGAGASYASAHIDCVRIFPNRIFTPEDAYEEYQRTRYYADGLLMKRRGWVRSVSAATIYARRTPIHARAGSRGAL